MKKILIASDHAGFPLKEQLKRELTVLDQSIEFIDLGTTDEKSVDYPDFSKKLAKAFLDGKGEAGILICGSGQGMAMGANRFKSIRAALCWDLPSAQLSRRHNDANILCLGSRLLPFGYAVEIAKVWLQTPFEGGRHQSRLDKLDH